jgi:hypothetical protein
VASHPAGVVISTAEQVGIRVVQGKPKLSSNKDEAPLQSLPTLGTKMDLMSSADGSAVGPVCWGFGRRRRRPDLQDL